VPDLPMATLNANPTIFQVSDEARGRDQTAGEADINERDPIDNLEVFGACQPTGPHLTLVSSFAHPTCKTSSSLVVTSSTHLKLMRPQYTAPVCSPAYAQTSHLYALRHPYIDLIREIKDPEHPHTLEQLRVAQRDLIAVDDERAHVHVRFTPTIPHCSMATLIGLCIRVKLLRTLPPRFKVDVSITPGTHASEAAVNKQLNDKERVAAALENDNLLSVVNKCLQGVTEDE
jgi:metal-sulfur cluster biosynthetic enzyme